MAGADFQVGRGSQGRGSRELVMAVPYPPALAERMRLLHTQLVHIFGRVVASYRRNAYDRCVTHLRHFDQQLRAYLCSEGAELEMYMGARLACEPDRLLTLHQVRARLRSLATQANEMLASQRTGRINPVRSAGFILTFEGMARTLHECVDLVELDFLTLCPPSLPADVAESPGFDEGDPAARPRWTAEILLFEPSPQAA